MDFQIGDVVQVADTEDLYLYPDEALMKYRGMVGVIVDRGSTLVVDMSFSENTNRDCWIVQFDDNSEIEVPAIYLLSE